MKNIEDNSMERTAELTPAESETLLRGHVWQQPENENLVCGAISSVIGARENQQDSCYMDIEPDGWNGRTKRWRNSEPAGSMYVCGGL